MQRETRKKFRILYPKQFLGFLALVTILGMVWLAWNLNLYLQREVEEERMRVTNKRVRGEVLRNDLAIGMSALAAAASGDPRWEKRYLELAPKLKEAYQEVVDFLPPEEDLLRAQAWDVYVKMERYRNEVFSLVREGKRERASEILHSEDYRTGEEQLRELTARICGRTHYWILIEYLKEKVLVLDEALTMSAILGAYTADPRWEEEYDKNDAMLLTTLDEISLLVPSSSMRESAARTDEANAKLVAMEREAFTLANANRKDQAQAILLGDVYREQKAIYAQGMRDLSEGLTQISRAAIKKEEAEASKQRVEVLVVLILMVITGILIRKVIKDWQEALVFKNMELNELNKTLDDRVKARTKQLEEQARQLELGNRDLQKNEEALRSMYKDIKKVHEEYKKTQSQLVQSEKLASIGQLAAGIAHEINNPIGYISSNIQTLGQYMASVQQVMAKAEALKQVIRKVDDERALDMVKQMDALEEGVNLKFILQDIDDLLKESTTGIERIRSIVMDLKTFSRKEKDETSLINVQQVMEEVLNILNNELKYTCEIIKDYKPVPLVKCNPQKLGQVFMNMLLNAKQAIKDRGKIHISIGSEDHRVAIAIADTGTGIPPEIMNDIFLPFFTTKPVGVGSGLGLSISYDIVKSYGGEIKVQSEPGKGATFTVVLPLLK